MFARIVEFLQQTQNHKLLVVVDRLEIKKQIIGRISTNYNGFAKIDNDKIVVESVTLILKHPDKQIAQYGIIIFYDAVVSSKVYDARLCAEKTTIVFTTIGNEISHNRSSNIIA